MNDARLSFNKDGGQMFYYKIEGAATILEWAANTKPSKNANAFTVITVSSHQPTWANTISGLDMWAPECQHKMRRFTEFCLRFESPVVPDPHFGGADGFEQVLDLVEDASDGLLRHVRCQGN